MNHAFHNVPKAIAKIQKPPLPAVEDVEESSDLQVEGIEKIKIPSNIIYLYTRLEILLGPKLSGQSDTLTEAINLIDELCKQGGTQNEQQYRNAPNKFKTQ